MKIGSIDLGKEPLLLAPMEDVSDSPFRTLCRSFGADMVYSEFISADALIRSVKGAERKLTINPLERPAVIQLYGRDPDTLAEAARIAAEAQPEAIDLNFGCPVKRVAGKGAGSGLLQNIPLLLEITRAVVKAVSLPVTVKTRLGWSGNYIIEEIAEPLQDCGISALTIHGRTRSQMYTGEADWRPIAAVKNNPRITIPIIGNGDLTSPERVREAFDKYGVDAVMIGRASIGRPWFFSEVKQYLQDGSISHHLSKLEQLEILRTMVCNNIHKLDERRGILHSRRHLAATPLFKGIPNFRPTRIAMLRAETLEELDGILLQCADMLRETDE